MKKKIVKNIFILILLLGVAAMLSIPILKDIKFGLDLKGGFEVLYQVETIDGSDLTSDVLNNTSKTLIKRIDVLGVTEPSITIEGNDKIRVQLAGVTNPDEARKVLGKAASLSFRDTNDKLLMTSSVLKAGGARVSSDNYGNPAVSLSVSDNETFYKVTKALSESEDKTMVIWLDFEEGTDSYSKTYSGRLCGTDSSNCLSAATVSQGFASDVIIQGNFTDAEVKSLVELINSGSLPTKLTEISSKTVAASFGDSSLTKTCVAGIVGISLIVLFMMFIYRFAGFVASIGIILYAFVTLFAFWLVGGVLTLPGIAAMVIGIGMAIDSSVISFARIKDELAKGTRLQMAYKNGNKNSFMAIFDSNLTTLVVAFVLFILGESSVKGFATMLIISTIVTMCIMVFLTRMLLGMFVKTGYFDKKLNFFIGYKEGRKTKFSFDFIKHSKKFLMATILVVIVGIFSLVRWGLKLGIDFKGGTSITIKAENALNKDELNKDIEKMEYTLEEIEFINDKDVIIKIDDSLSHEDVLTSEKYFQEKYKAQTEIGVVSNVVKKQLVKNAFISVLVASICIVLYISFRFKFSFAIAAIIALLHDVFLIVAAFSLLQLEVNSMFIAAILSIIGYSINDTIVTFDRIRENIKEKKSNKILASNELKEAVNNSLNQTLGRSIVTTMTTLMPVISLIILGSHEIINFNIALLVGLIAGVYSSIFIASQIWFMIEKHSSGKPIKKKWYEE